MTFIQIASIILFSLYYIFSTLILFVYELPDPTNTKKAKIAMVILTIVVDAILLYYFVGVLNGTFPERR